MRCASAGQARDDVRQGIHLTVQADQQVRQSSRSCRSAHSKCRNSDAAHTHIHLGHHRAEAVVALEHQEAQVGPGVQKVSEGQGGSIRRREVGKQEGMAPNHSPPAKWERCPTCAQAIAMVWAVLGCCPCLYVKML